MKRHSLSSSRTLHLSKETVRNLLSSELQRVAAGGACPSRADCSSATSASLNECGSLYCSMMQY